MTENQTLIAEVKALIPNQDTIHHDLILMFPIAEGQAYTGSLCNHFRGKLKDYGAEGLIETMGNGALRIVIEFYKTKIHGT